MIQEGVGINVTGAGSATNPYLISAGDIPIGGKLTVRDTETVDLSLNGEGTDGEPFILEAVAQLDLNELENVDTAAGIEGYVLAQDADGTFSMHPPVTAEPGLIEHDGTLQGDGSTDAPLGILEVNTDDTLNGAGSLADPLTIGDRSWRLIGSGTIADDELAIVVPEPYQRLRLFMRGGSDSGGLIGVRPKFDNQDTIGEPGIYRYTRTRINGNGDSEASHADDGVYGWYIGEWGTAHNTAVIHMYNTDSPTHFISYYADAYRNAGAAGSNVHSESWGRSDPIGTPVTDIRVWISGSGVFRFLTWWLEGIPAEPGGAPLEEVPEVPDNEPTWLTPWGPDPDVE